MTYTYGMRLRGFSIGCQPKQGLIDFIGDPSGKYYNLLIYDRELTGQELNDYDLSYLAPITIDIRRREVIE